MTKRLTIALFLLTGARAYAGAGLKLPYVAPVQGQVSSVTSEESVDGTLTVDGKSSPMKQALAETYTEEIVTVSGDAVTKEKITVAGAHNTVDAMGHKQDTDLPIKGKTYVVTGDGKTTTVTTDAGAAVDKAEETVVGRMVEHIGLPDKFGQFMSATTFVKGKKVTLSADQVSAMMGKQEGMSASDVALTLKGQDAKTATFAMDGTLTGKQNGMDMTIVFKAIVKVDVKASRPLDFKMTGTIKGAGDMGGKKIAMTGAMTAHKAITYR